MESLEYVHPEQNSLGYVFPNEPSFLTQLGIIYLTQSIHFGLVIEHLAIPLDPTQGNLIPKVYHRIDYSNLSNSPIVNSSSSLN